MIQLYKQHLKFNNEDDVCVMICLCVCFRSREWNRYRDVYVYLLFAFADRSVEDVSVLFGLADSDHLFRWLLLRSFTCVESNDAAASSCFLRVIFDFCQTPVYFVENIKNKKKIRNKTYFDDLIILYIIYNTFYFIII